MQILNKGMNVMKISRRSFLASSSAFVALRSLASEKPIWTAGIVTDTHVMRTRQSCERVKMACDLFAEKGVDLFVNCGDIADLYYPEAYPILKELTDGAFPVKKPKKIWVYANHDRCGRKEEPWEKVFADVRRLLEDENDFYDLIDMHGFPLLVFPQFLDFTKAEKMISDVCADPKYEGKPIILFDHVPPFDTTDNSVRWGCENRLALYSKFPRLVVVCGHAHSSIHSDSNIWQGAFTAVGMGCLCGWTGRAVGLAPEGKSSYGAVILEAYSDRLVFRRFDVRTKEEYLPECPWTIPLPFDSATAPYRRDSFALTMPVPEFPENAGLSVQADSPFTAVTFSFPQVTGKYGAYHYKVQVFTASGEQCARCDLSGQFYLTEKERSPTVTRRLSAAYFDPGKSYKVRIVPCNCFGKAGSAIEAEFKVPDSFGEYKTVFESLNPMAECPFIVSLKGTKRLAAKDGWYEVDKGAFRLEFPKDIWKGTGKFRFSVDMETRQTKSRTYTLLLRNLKPSRNANARIYTPKGESGKMRYVIEFDKKNPTHHYCLLLREGDKGYVRFDRVGIERI